MTTPDKGGTVLANIQKHVISHISGSIYVILATGDGNIHEVYYGQLG